MTDLSSQTVDQSGFADVVQPIGAAHSNPRVGASDTAWLGKRGSREEQFGPEHGAVGALGTDCESSGSAPFTEAMERPWSDSCVTR